MLDIPYIPDMDRLMNEYEDAVGRRWCDAMKDNPYVNFLQSYGFLKVENETICKDGKYDLSDKTSRIKYFSLFLQNWEFSKSVLMSVGDEGSSLRDLTNSLINTILPDSLMVIVSWLERIKLLKYEKDRYFIDATDYDFADSGESIYPLKYNVPLNITEDKYSVYEYLRKISRNQIDLAPDFQRKLVWSIEQKSRFIESALLQIPIPPFYMKKMSDSRMVIIDGLQRTFALREFINNEFALTGLNALSDLNGKTFSDLEKEDGGMAARIEDKQLFFYVLATDVPMAAVYDIFNRINTGGTQLERQEIRHCVFIGNATSMLKEIAESKDFKDSIDKGISDNRMKAREAILRCLAFTLMGIDEYKGSIDDILERTMKKLNTMSHVEIDDIKNETLKVFRTTQALFREKNFRIPTDWGRGRINVAAMETVFNCFWKRSVDIGKEKDWLNRQMYQLVRDKKFLDSFQKSTSSKSGVFTRFKIAHQYLDSHD